RPVASSKPFAVLHVFPCVRVRSLLPGVSTVAFDQLMQRVMSTKPVPYTFSFCSALSLGARFPTRPLRQLCATSAVIPAMSGAAMLVPPTAVDASGGVATPESWNTSPTPAFADTSGTSRHVVHVALLATGCQLGRAKWCDCPPPPAF